MKTEEQPTMIDVPMPIRTPRLLIRTKQEGDGAPTVAAVTETWSDLHLWMTWAENLKDFTIEQQEIRIREQTAKFILRQEFNLLGIENVSGQPVIWCGFHDMHWKTRQCHIGFWVRKSAQKRGIATEATNALLRYAFGALGMRRVGITHSDGNEASRRIAEKLGFSSEGIDKTANRLPGGRMADRFLYARVDLSGMPPLDVRWGV